MDCRGARDRLRRGGADPLPEDVRRHAASCRHCAAELRASALLALGSGPADGTPRPGFSDRLRARLAAAGPPPAAGWADSVGLAARPALGLAAAAVLLSAGLYLVTAGATASDDLALLLESDPVNGSLFAPADTPGGPTPLAPESVR